MLYYLDVKLRQWLCFLRCGARGRGGGEPLVSLGTTPRSAGGAGVGVVGFHATPSTLGPSPASGLTTLTPSAVSGGDVGYSDEKVANREIRVWHGATEKWSLNNGQIQNPLA